MAWPVLQKLFHPHRDSLSPLRKCDGLGGAVVTQASVTFAPASTTPVSLLPLQNIRGDRSVMKPSDSERKLQSKEGVRGWGGVQRILVTRHVQKLYYDYILGLCQFTSVSKARL